MPPGSKPALAQLKQLPDHEIFALVGIEAGSAVRPRSWCCWQKPSPALPIDHAVEGLLGRTRHPKVPRSQRARMEWCPFWQARFSTACAAVNASRHEEEWSSTFNLRIEKLAAIVSRSAELKNVLGGLLGALDQVSFSKSPAPHSRLDDVSGCPSGYAAKDFIQAIGGDFKRALTEVSLSASEAHAALDKYSKRRDANVWQAAFAFRIGQLWCLIFEDIPGRQNDGPFVDLISKAFETVCSDEGVSWNRAKTAAFERHDEAAHGDDFDRCLIRRSRPLAASEVHARLAHAEAQNEADIEAAMRALARQKGTLN